jgi:hypothetical protein
VRPVVEAVLDGTEIVGGAGRQIAAFAEVLASTPLVFSLVPRCVLGTGNGRPAKRPLKMRMIMELAQRAGGALEADATRVRGRPDWMWG